MKFKMNCNTVQMNMNVFNEYFNYCPWEINFQWYCITHSEKKRDYHCGYYVRHSYVCAQNEQHIKSEEYFLTSFNITLSICNIGNGHLLSFWNWLFPNILSLITLLVICRNRTGGCTIQKKTCLPTLWRLKLQFSYTS